MNRIKILRKNKKMTLKELSEALNSKYGMTISDGQLSNYENENREPRLSNFWENIADYFDVSVPYIRGLVGLDDNEIKDYFDKIQDIEIREFQNELYKELYNPSLKYELFKKMTDKIDFNSLNSFGAKKEIKTFLDRELHEIKEKKQYLPHTNKNAVLFAHDKLKNTMKEIDNYFLDPNLDENLYRSFLDDSEINKNLSTDLYNCILNKFEELSAFLTDQYNKQEE